MSDNPYHDLLVFVGTIWEEELQRIADVPANGRPPDPSVRHGEIGCRLEAFRRTIRSAELPTGFLASEVDHRVNELIDSTLALVRWPTSIPSPPVDAGLRSSIAWPPADELYREMGPLFDRVDRARESAVALASRFGQVQDSSPPNEGGLPIPSADEEDVSILRALVKRYPLRLTQDQIEAATKPRVSRRTIAERMPQLEREGLVDQPRGKKQGYIISAQGRNLLQQIDATTP